MWCEMTSGNGSGRGEPFNNSLLKAHAMAMANSHLLEVLFPLAQGKRHSEHYIREQWSYLQVYLSLASEAHKDTAWSTEVSDYAVKYSTKLQGCTLFHQIEFAPEVHHNRRLRQLTGAHRGKQTCGHL